MGGSRGVDPLPKMRFMREEWRVSGRDGLHSHTRLYFCPSPQVKNSSSGRGGVNIHNLGRTGANKKEPPTPPPSNLVFRIFPDFNIIFHNGHY